MSTLIHPDAWAYLVTHYLRPVQPPFATSYRAMVRAAEDNGWSPVPSLRALRRRMDTEISVAAQLAARTAHKPRRVAP
ncbi:MAG: hypothetical protein DI589_25550 [Shinella sp.]|nr:MAG: hypothetical protein DI589_25550 [Shinella sp.]